MANLDLWKILLVPRKKRWRENSKHGKTEKKQNQQISKHYFFESQHKFMKPFSAKLEKIRQEEYEKLKNKEAHVQEAVEKKKAAIDARFQKKTLQITEKANKYRSTGKLPKKCFGICSD
ncbi:unnamed protein product [Dovyalis caffra]|uniref:Remorin C-terminal domain-containing protein n=1 Tax=Dovyalis caffra TaxID=77055 RepID=A0AAV1RKV5_9ROSI|nr:unnamed protein product [Dovyalis caffra]